MAALSAVRDERGLTLTEVTVVMVLGTMIMAGMVAFYLSSQGLWLEASTQAITQREASLLTAAMRDSIRQSGSALVTPSPDALHQQLSLYRPGASTPYYYFWWEPSDSLIHAGPTLTRGPATAMIQSRAVRMQMLAAASAVRVDLQLHSANGDRVDASAYAVMKNSAEYARLVNR